MEWFEGQKKNQELNLETMGLWIGSEESGDNEIKNKGYTRQQWKGAEDRTTWTAGEACREARCWILDEGHILWLNNLLYSQPRLEKVQKEVGAKERYVEAINQWLDTSGRPCIRWPLWKMPRILQCTEISTGLRQVWGLLNCQQQSQHGKRYSWSSKHSKKGEGSLTSKWMPANEHWPNRV